MGTPFQENEKKKNRKKKNRKNRKKSRKSNNFLSALWRGGRKRKRWVTSLTSPYLRQMRRGSIHHASIESTLCGACRHRLQPLRGPCVGYLIDKVVRLHVLSDVR